MNAFSLTSCKEFTVDILYICLQDKIKMTAQEFNDLSEFYKLNLIGLRNQIHVVISKGGKRIDKLYDLNNCYVEFLNSPEEKLYLIKAFIKDADEKPLSESE